MFTQTISINDQLKNELEIYANLENTTISNIIEKMLIEQSEIKKRDYIEMQNFLKESEDNYLEMLKWKNVVEFTWI